MVGTVEEYVSRRPPQRSRVIAVVAMASIVCLVAGCGAPADDVAVQRPAVAEQAESAAVSVASDLTTLSPEAVEAWANLLRSAPLNQIYDRDHPPSLEQLTAASDFRLSGRLASVELAEPQEMQLVPDPAPEPLPFEPDLVARGVTLVLDDVSVVGTDATDLGVSGGSMRIELMLFSGPRSSVVADDVIAEIISTAPIGASVVGFGQQAGVTSSGVNVGPYGFLVAAGGAGSALSADPGLDEAVGGRTFDQVVAEAMSAGG